MTSVGPNRSRLFCSIPWSYFMIFIFLFLERLEGREKERERNINVWLPLMSPTGDPTRNPGTCPDWESNL